MLIARPPAYAVTAEALTFLRACWVAPADRLPALVYADYLEERPHLAGAAEAAALIRAAASGAWPAEWPESGAVWPLYSAGAAHWLLPAALVRDWEPCVYRLPRGDGYAVRVSGAAGTPRDAVPWHAWLAGGLPARLECRDWPGLVRAVGGPAADLCPIHLGAGLADSVCGLVPAPWEW